MEKFKTKINFNGTDVDAEFEIDEYTVTISIDTEGIMFIFEKELVQDNSNSDTKE